MRGFLQARSKKLFRLQLERAVGGMADDLAQAGRTPGPRGPEGPPGPPGPGVEMRSTATHLQYRNKGETEWTNIATLVSLNLKVL